MVDSYFNPLDAAPVSRPNPLLKNQQSSAQGTHAGQSFREILQQKYDQEPTPMITPESLMPPIILSRETKGAAPADPDTLQVDTVEQSPLPNQISTPITIPAPSIPTAASGVDILSATASGVPQNLKELLQSQTLGTSSPEEPGSEAFPQNPVEAPEETSLETPPVSSVLEPEQPTPPEESTDVNIHYTIQRGDTLSGIISSALKSQGVPYSTADIYQLVNVVAKDNGIRNPNRIFAGQSLDLSSVFMDAPLADNSGSSLTTFVDQVERGDYQPPAVGTLTSTFGSRLHPIHNDERFHNGVDIAMPNGTPVKPYRDGIVSFAGERGEYGNLIEIDHGDGTRSRYAHLSELAVAEGDSVTRNSLLGRSGSTGASTGPHLHFEIRQSSRPVDPLAYLSADTIEGRLVPDTARLAQASEE